MKVTDDQIEDVIASCNEAMDEGSRWPGMSYEQGVAAALEWVQGRGDHPIDTE